MGANVSKPEEITEYLIHEIKNTKGYKEYQYFNGKPVFQINDLKDMSIIELFEAYSAIKLVPEALDLLYEKIIYGDLEALSHINKPNFYEKNSIELFIKNLREVKKSYDKNITNIKKEEMMMFFDENTLISLDSIPPSNPRKIKEFNESSINSLIKSKKLYCIEEKQYNEYVQRCENEYIRYSNEKNSKKIKIFFYVRLALALFLAIKVCYYYWDNYNNIGYFLTAAVYPPTFMVGISILTDDEKGSGLVFGGLANLALCLTWLSANIANNPWSTVGFILGLVVIIIAFLVYASILYYVYLFTAAILSFTLHPIGRRLGILTHPPDTNTDNSNQQRNHALY